MKKLLSRLKKAADWLDAPDDPKLAAYDPVHLGAVLIVNFVVVGLLYWLLWTLLVYEGGIFSKFKPLLELCFGGKTLAELGYRGSYDQGAFDGWRGNLVALILTAAAVVALHSLYRDALKRKR